MMRHLRLLKKLGKRSLEPSADSSAPWAGSKAESSVVSPRSERYGLTLLAGGPFARPEDGPGTDHYPVDIIAVHGLNGDAYTTWTHENGVLWLRDLLPGLLPGCRVFTYGYPSKVAFTASFARVQEYARQLLSSLRDVQEDTNEHPRPVIFICHSLGGIVCKQTLVFAHEDDATYGGVLKSVVGVIFLGTPHRGSSVATLGSVVGAIVNFPGLLAAKAVRTDLLDYLKLGSQHLQDLATSVRNRLADITVVSFYESEAQYPLASVIVDQASAVLNIPGEDIISLPANHRDLCRFPGETSGAYKAVSAAVRRIAQANTWRMTSSAPNRESTHSSQRTLDNSEKSCMRLLSEFDVSDYRAMLSKPARGHPGCGKTVLSLYLAKQLESDLASSPSSNVCIYFCDDKVTKQRDARNALIGLIFQLVHRHPSLVRYASKAYEMAGQSIFRSFTALWNIFMKITRDPKYGPTYVIIDGLDECEMDTRFYLIESIRNVMQNLDLPLVGKNHVKFVLAARPFTAPELTSYSVSDGVEYRIPIDESQGGYQQDVHTFIQQRVRDMSQQRSFPPEIQDFLQQTLSSQSGQTFLWVHMVLSSLSKNPLSSKKDLQDAITRIPTELERTYLSLLSAIPPSFESLASKMLKLILGSSRHLSLGELNIALTISPDHHTTEDVESECQTAMLHTLEGVLGPLVKVSDSKVKLVHQSVKEFVLQNPGTRGALDLVSAVRAITTQECALAIAEACVDYLILDDFAEDLFSLQRSPTSPDSGFNVSTADDNESPVSPSSELLWYDEAHGLNAEMLFGEPDVVVETTRHDVVSKHGFYQYSAMNWARHFAACEASAPPRLREAAKSLLDKRNPFGSNWLRYFSSETNTEYHDVPSSLSAVALAGYFNLHGTLLGFLDHSTVAQSELDCTLFWGAEQGHSNIVEALIRAGADPNAQVSGGQSALPAASQNGHLSSVVALLACDRADLNARGKTGRTALSFACAGGYIGIAKMLLSRPECMPDEEDDSGATALFWAAGGGHLQLVSFLAQHQPAINVNHQDKRGRTTLSWAAGDGMDDVVRPLLKLRRVDVNLPDSQGRSPLSWAAGNGYTAVVRALLQDKRTNKGTVDKDGRNAISWACGGGHVDTLQMLLRYRCPGVDDKDANGWSPLAWAIETNSPNTVQTLVTTGSVNLEQGDTTGRSPLSWAVGYGHAEVVRVLLRARADPYSKSKWGFTPLSTAEQFGRNDIKADLLLYMENMPKPGQEDQASTDSAQ